METLLMEGKDWSSLLVITIALSSIKFCIFYLARSYYWGFSHFIFFSISNIEETETRSRSFIKVLNNFLTILIVYFLIVTSLSLQREYEKYKTITETPTDVIEKEAPEMVQTVSYNYTDTTYPTVETANNPIYNVSKEPKPAIKSIARIAITKPVKKLTAKLFSVGKMYMILDMLRAKRDELGSTSNCVQIIKTKTSNVTNAFELAKFFQKNGFVVAGREVKSTLVKGIKINLEGIIFKITVGTN